MSSLERKGKLLSSTQVLALESDTETGGWARWKVGGKDVLA
jgi:hypothetical protein